MIRAATLPARAAGPPGRRAARLGSTPNNRNRTRP